MVVLKPNVVRGGRAIGLGNNLYLMKGRTHEKGGIDIGKNPETGLEVERDEVVQVLGGTNSASPKGIRVFSAQPILGGISPAQYILGGANPNQVFNAQEQWKKINRINDDGTKKARFGTEEDSKRDSSQVNIFRPSQDNSKVQANRIAHRKSLEKFIKDNPNLYGINTADFVDFMLDNATMESNNSSTASHGSMYGYYQLKGLKKGSTEEQQHRAAYKHLSNLFKNVITDADIEKAKELGISQAQLLHKFWNQERKVLNYLYQGKDSEDGLGTKISEWGNNNNLEIDYSPYVMKAIKDKNYTIQKGDYPETIMKRYRGYGDKIRTFNNYNKDINTIFGVDTTKPLKIGDILKNKYYQGIGPIKEDGTFKYGGRKIAQDGIKKENDDFKSVIKREDFEPTKFKKFLRKLYASDESDAAVNRYGDFSRMYFGVPLKDGYLYKSNYKPTKSKNPNAVYYGVKNMSFIQDLITLYNEPGLFEKPRTGVVDGYSTKGFNRGPNFTKYVSPDLGRDLADGKKVKLGKTPHTLGPGALGNFTISRGKDEKGEYLSYYDLWDVAPKRSKKAEQRGFAKPYELYDRIYGTFDKDGTFHPEGEIGESYITAEKKYGGIHIKPSKRGTFTAAAKKHGMSVQGFASKVLANKGKYSSAMVKKANFARNASKWKHKEFGGDMDFNYWITKNNIYKLGGRKKGQWGLQDYSNSFKVNLQPFNPSPVTSTNVNNNLSLGIPNLIGAGLNLAGNVASYFVNRRALKSMQPPIAPSAPTPLRAENLETRVSTAAQEAALRENIAKQENLIAGNLSSSRSRLNAVNAIRNQGIGLYNQLQERKQNVQTELINRAKLNRQQINTQNTLLSNQYKDKVTNWKNSVIDFENKRKDALSENVVQHLIQGPIDAIAGERGFFDNLQSNDRYRMTAFLQAITSPDALKAMNSNEIRQLAQKFGVRTSWLRSIGINV